MLKYIIDKQHYNQRLSYLLSLIYPALIEYYGEDLKDLIDRSLMETPIYIAKTNQNIYDCLKEVGYFENDYEGSHLKKSSGGYCNRPLLDFKNGKFTLKEVRRSIAVVDYGNETILIACLIHEICHLIKSYESEYIIDGNRLYARSGLILEETELSYENGKVIEKFISEKGVGFEEAINIFDEENIMQMFFAPEYKVEENGVMNDFVRKLINELGIIKDIHNAQFNNKKDYLRELLNPNLYDKLESELDIMYYDFIKHNRDRLKLVLSQRNKIIKVTTPLLNQMKGMKQNARTSGS